MFCLERELEERNGGGEKGDELVRLLDYGFVHVASFEGRREVKGMSIFLPE